MPRAEPRIFFLSSLSKPYFALWLRFIHVLIKHAQRPCGAPGVVLKAENTVG